jgi:hypothetical protein
MDASDADRSARQFMAANRLTNGAAQSPKDGSLPADNPPIVHHALHGAEKNKMVSRETLNTMNRVSSADELILGSLSRAKKRLALLIAVPTLVGILLAVFVSRGIERSLREISHKMDEAAGHMDATSYEVSTASQSLARGATEQAALLADTFANLEGMASIGKQNAVSANQANGLIHRSSKTVESASGSMRELTRSMMEISEASEETQKIVKAIDEIAFQTNLLALNAAVEAARAGEAGAGFAVVAQEVRSLAVRAAGAARRTAELIEDTVRKVGSGMGQVNRTSEAFSEIASSIIDARDLMAEIAAASDKQARGVDEIKKAIAEVKIITQENASNAEVTASVSEEITGQGKEMRDIVGELIALVVGNVRLSEDSLASLQGALRELVDDPQLRNLDKRTHRMVLNRWLAAHPEMEAVYSNDAEGRFIYSEPPAGLSNASVRPWWQRAMTGKEYVSPVYISAITRKACCTLSFPLRSADGEVAGVLGVDLKVG